MPLRECVSEQSQSMQNPIKYLHSHPAFFHLTFDTHVATSDGKVNAAGLIELQISLPIISLPSQQDMV